MRCLQYAKIGNNKANGVAVIVPKHLESLAEYWDVEFYDFRNEYYKCNLKSSKVIYLNDNVQSPCFWMWESPYNKPDLVVFHEPFVSLRYLRIAKKLRKLKIPYILVPHSCFTKAALKVKYIKKRLALLTLYRNFVLGAAGIQFLTKNEMETSKYSDKGFVIPNGISALKEKITKKQNESFDFIFIGRKDIYHKGIDVLLDSIKFSEEKLRLFRGKLKLYGPDFRRGNNYIDDYVRKHALTDIVENYPAVYDEDKEKVFIDSKIFVLTSRLEGMPVTALEALHYQLPILVTPGTNLCNYVVDYNAGWCSQLNAQEISKTIINILEDQSLLKEFSQNTSRLINENFTWIEIAKKTRAEYTRIVANYEK